jgi:O-methyltransferase
MGSATVQSRASALWNEVQQVDLHSPAALIESFSLLWLLFRVRKHTMVLRPRLRALYRLAQQLDAHSIPGDIVECGVYNGGSAGVLAYASRHAHPARTLWLFDSFEGLPPATEKDGAKAQDRTGTCRGSEQKVQELMETLGIAKDRVKINKGWFHDTFPRVRVEAISLLHIDADWYDSVRLCLDRFYDLVSPRGYIVLDDYGHWVGCRTAVDEFITARGLKVDLQQIDYTGYYFRKPQ